MYTFTLHAFPMTLWNIYTTVSYSRQLPSPSFCKTSVLCPCRSIIEELVKSIRTDSV